ncbi:MAG: extracellular solute-binding protein [Alphaproteobacteria bacterium]|nr:MAG: extracellular solute-binding protein [Alphaproteobacteria bacterium]
MDRSILAKRLFWLAGAMATWALVAALSAAPAAARDFIVLQSTTSTQNSGLLDAILPIFTARTGIEVRVVAVGTGQALRNARNGDGDVVLVHARAAEDAFVAEGWGIDRRDVMYNDFVVVGPEADPAGVKGAADVLEAFRRIARARAAFASRGDDSGTHKRELALWQAAGVDIAAESGRWYLETGSGMGATLNLAAGVGAYTLTDRATWLSFGNRRGLRLLFEGDPRLFNQYGVIRVNPARHPHVNAEGAKAFVDWLTGPEGQAAIAAYRLNGVQLFFPNAAAR